MQVELVSVVTQDGVRLDGALSESDATNALGIDMVIFHHGLGGSFYAPSMAAELSERFVQAGCAVLRTNSRGHDQAFSSPKGLLGAAYEIVDDCRHDVRAWIDVAEAAGYRQIAVWGHSLGAIKTIYYLAIAKDPRVRCCLLSSPPRFVYEQFVSGEGGSGRAASIAAAEELIAQGRGNELVAFDLGNMAQFSARSLVDKYGPEDRYDFFRYLPDVATPALLTIGGLEDGFRFDDLAREGKRLAEEQANLTFASIEGADHSYLGRIPELWSAAHNWLVSLPAPPR